MPDRSYGTITLTADLTTLPTSLHLTTAQGTTLASITPTQVAGTRYQGSTTIPSSPRDDGLWTAEWRNGGTTLLVQTFSVSTRPAASSCLADLVLQTAERVRPVWRGVLTDGAQDTALDPALIGLNADVAGLFFLRLPPDDSMGEWRRVSSYGNQILAFEYPFAEALEAGDPYALLSLSPSHVEQAVRRAIHTLGQLSRLPVMSEGISLLSEQGEAVLARVPTGWSGVHQVWVIDGANDARTLLRPEQWTMQPGGLIHLSQAPDNAARTLTLLGTMDPVNPCWWDSQIDLDPAMVSAQASIELLLSHAGSAAIDPEDRLRRVALAGQELGDLRRVRRRRIPTNSRPVVR